ncbi:unnamed protein product [Staurois parvus]|uniref:Uncharacterized protein n=1 Tax=Staurois parvus TaxID=386267 RepID=A0ABN9DYP1_9NEOB|nr:unnamed protein product [Staurois parvus]
MGPPGNRGSWGPCVLAQTQKKPMKKVPGGISWGPLLTPGPRAVPEFPNGQSAPGPDWKGNYRTVSPHQISIRWEVVHRENWEQ